MMQQEVSWMERLVGSMRIVLIKVCFGLIGLQDDFSNFIKGYYWRFDGGREFRSGLEG